VKKFGGMVTMTLALAVDAAPAAILGEFCLRSDLPNENPFYIVCPQGAANWAGPNAA